MAEYLQNPFQRLYPKHLETGVVMPPVYILLWTAATACLPLWLVFFYLPGGPAYLSIYQALILIAQIAIVVPLLLHALRARSGTGKNPTTPPRFVSETNAPLLLWAAFVTVCLGIFGLLGQILYVDWSMANYGGRYLVATLPAAVLLALFSLSTLASLATAPRQKIAALLFAGLLFAFDLYSGALLHTFYGDHPTQPALQHSEEVQ